MNERTPWILSTILLGALCVVIALVPIRLVAQLEAQAPVIETYGQKCHVVRYGLESVRSNLGSANLRDFGETQYKTFTRGNWAEPNMCSAIHVGEFCEGNDLPCELHALDWALVNIR